MEHICTMRNVNKPLPLNGKIAFLQFVALAGECVIKIQQRAVNEEGESRFYTQTEKVSFIRFKGRWNFIALKVKNQINVML